jgi:hypothetical protein
MAEGHAPPERVTLGVHSCARPTRIASEWCDCQVGGDSLDDTLVEYVPVRPEGQEPAGAWSREEARLRRALQQVSGELRELAADDERATCDVLDGLADFVDGAAASSPGPTGVDEQPADPTGEASGLASSPGSREPGEAPYRVQALPQSDIVPRWTWHPTLAAAKAAALGFEGKDGRHHAQIRDDNGNVVWDRDEDGWAALRAAQAHPEPGTISNIRFFDRALTEEEIAGLYERARADAVREIAVAAFLRGATYREATNAPTPPDDVILSMLGQAGILPADGECPSRGSRGPVGSVCRGHDAPAADGSWRGPIRAALSPESGGNDRG